MKKVTVQPDICRYARYGVYCRRSFLRWQAEGTRCGEGGYVTLRDIIFNARCFTGRVVLRSVCRRSR